jgi:dolichol-phosphate mannosyltransferase
VSDHGPVLVIVPTYNEAESLPGVLARLLSAVPHVNVLVADDGSPDGTGAIADALAAQDSRIHVLHRSAKAGLGAAYIAGFRWGLARGYGVLVEMDADGSHRPEDLPRLLAALDRADLVLGSRWVPGGTVVNWPASRRLISRGGTMYAKLALGIHIRDATGGFRAFRRQTLEGLDLDGVSSQGYCFQIDLAWRAVQRGFTVVEVPITFVERELGVSKMSRSIVVEALWRVTAWGVESRVARARSWARTRGARTSPAVPPAGKALSDRQADDQPSAATRSRRIVGAAALTRPPAARRNRVEDRSEV